MVEELSVDGHRISFTRDGSGSPLVLLHGLGADNRQTLNALAGLPGWQRICPDLPGHGKTPSARTGFGAFSEIVHGLLEALGIRRAVVGGISMGAAISLRLALDFPASIAGLLLIRPAWLAGPALPHLGIVDRIGRWQGAGPDQVPALLAEDREYHDLERNNPLAAQSLRGLLTRPQANEAASVLCDMVADRPVDSLGRLSAIESAALVFVNDGDPLHPIAIGEEIADRLPAAQLIHLPSRYLHPLEHELALGASAAAFLEKIGELECSLHAPPGMQSSAS